MSQSAKSYSKVKTRQQIVKDIGRAIREGRYLSITYKNQGGTITPFWISILDINEYDELTVNMYNVTKEEPICEGKIFISSIQSTEILKFSHYEVSEELIRKIDRDKSLENYKFDKFDNNLLLYFQACYDANQDPFLYKSHLIKSLDLKTLTSQNPYFLTPQQQSDINKEVYHNNYSQFYQYELAICELSIDIESRKFVVAYRTLAYDPVERTLECGTETHFNPNFLINEIKHSLSYYSDTSPADFEKLYRESKEEAISCLIENFRKGELHNTLPEIVVLGYRKIDISAIFEEINSQNESNELEIPLKALFRSTSILDRKNRKEPKNIICLNEKKVNTYQLQTLYNALKYPITYVKGPPGTGKTETILNLIVNCLLNKKTLLITSNNNIPLDSIYSKFNVGTYRDRQIQFPIIRLGNQGVTLKAIDRIKELFEFDTKDEPFESMLNKIEDKSKEKNKALNEKLKLIDKRLDIEQKLEFINNLLTKGSYRLLETEKIFLEKEIEGLPIADDNDFKGMFDAIENNHHLLQYFYFESLRHIKLLKKEAYNELTEIIYLPKESDRVSKFNRWISEDQNLQLFIKVFPIIITTNISSRKLGHKEKFDLLAMDEAGQCEIATSLIPISKCKSMVLIGDTDQLKPIILIEESKNEKLKKLYKIESEYDYVSNSILSLYTNEDSVSGNITLKQHYRCGYKIIKYSNMRFYENKLDLSKIKTIGEVKLLEVKNLNPKKKNSYFEEALKIIDFIKSNRLEDVYILTPFRNQEEVINHYLKIGQEKGEIHSSVNCGTIHKVQGQENKTIIISTAISAATNPRTYDWIKNSSELLNVGVTRAKENLIVVADKSAIDILSKKNDDLYALVEYALENGKTDVQPSRANKLTIGLSNNSKFEDEFYKTMQHYCTVNGSKFERNVSLIDLFPEEKSNDVLKRFEFDGVLYQDKEPKVVFEMNGPEHYTKSNRIESDKAKSKFLKTKNIELIAIPNHYCKHYEYISNLINKMHKYAYQKELFDYSG